MNGKLILGISFQVIQFLILGIGLMIYILDGLTMSKQLYTIIFGGLIFVLLNIFSITLIILGMKE